MYNETYQPSLSEAEEGVLISRTAREQYCRARTVTEIAQRHARNIVTRAQHEASLLHTEGWRQGYCDGLLAAVDSVTGYIASGETLRQRLQYELQDEVTRLLAETLQNADILPQLVAGWTQQLASEESDQAVTLLLPQAWRRDVGRLAASLSAACSRPLRYEYHHHMRCVLKYRDRLAEFDPVEITQRLCEDLLTAKSLPRITQQLTKESLLQLKETIGQRLDTLICLSDSKSEPERRGDND